jgi:dephospho-CoA kinase
MADGIVAKAERMRARGWVIGITGGTGAGKSALVARLRRLGAAACHVDHLAHALYEPGSRIARAVARRFGSRVAAPDGGIDRARLGEAAFRSAEALAGLDRIVRPALARDARAAVRRMRARHRLVAVEAGAILFDLGLDRLADRVVVMRAPAAVRAARLARRGLPAAAARNRLRALAGVERRLEARARRCTRAIRVDGGGPPARLDALAGRFAAEAA